MAILPSQTRSRPERSGLGRPVALGIVLGAVLLVAVVAGMRWWETTGRWSSTPIQSIAQTGDGDYELIVGCGVGDARASALELDDRIIVSAEITGSVSQNEGATLIHVRLVEPIGDRTVIDEATGNTVKVLDRG